MTPVSVVTGANSGIGRAIAVHLAGVGHHVYGTVRSKERAAKLEAMASEAGVTVELAVVDVGDDDSVRTGFAEILDRAGRIDTLVNNAGIAGNGVAEETPISRYAELMNVNLYGPLRCIQAVLPQMRARHSGCIVNISSVAGRVAAIAQQPYVASKWALEGMSEALAQELAPHGVRVAIIEPGVTKSAILAKNTDTPNASGAYDAAYRRLFQFYASAHPSNPFDVAVVVANVISSPRPSLRHTVGWGGHELVAGRATITDADWVDLGRMDDDGYYDAFERHFGLDIHPVRTP